MKQLKYIFIIPFILLTGCSFLNDIFVDNTTNNIQDSFTGIDKDIWSEFVDLTNLPDCQLPCLWGLDIGENDLAEVLDFLQETEFGRYYERQTANDSIHEVWVRQDGYTLDFTGRGTSDIGDVDFFFSFDEENTLRTIKLNMRSPRRWLADEDNPLLISSLLNEIETMPNVLISAPQNARVSDFAFILVYPQNNFQIIYRLDISEAYPIICLNSENIGNLNLEITNYPNQFVEENDTFIAIENSWLVRGSAITTEEFIQFFRDNPNSCLDLTQYP